MEKSALTVVIHELQYITRAFGEFHVLVFDVSIGIAMQQIPVKL